MKARASLIGLIIWLALGLSIKHLRYSEPVLIEIAGAEIAVKEFFTQQGWQFSERLTLSPDIRYGTLVFKNSACPDQVAIMLMDTGDSISELFERATKGNVIYLENSKRYASPPTARLLAHIMWNSVRNSLGGDFPPAFPIVAVAPKSAIESGPCNTRLIEDWAKLTGLRPAS